MLCLCVFGLSSICKLHDWAVLNVCLKLGAYVVNAGFGQTLDVATECVRFQALDMFGGCLISAAFSNIATFGL